MCLDCPKCCPIGGGASYKLRTRTRSPLHLQPVRYDRWLSKLATSATDGAAAAATATTAAAPVLLREIRQSSMRSKRELQQMQSYSLWKVSLQLNRLLRWFPGSGQGQGRRVVAVRLLEPLPRRLSTAVQDAMPYLRAYFPFFDVQLLPVGDCDGCGGSFLEDSAGAAELVRKEIKGTTRLEAGSVLRSLLRHPASSCDLQIGVCLTDLYPGPDMLGKGQSGAFILGQSSAAHRAAVVCFGRASSAPLDDDAAASEEDAAAADSTAGQPLTSASWRVRKVLSHELCHLLGLDHCCYYRCNMNASESMSEALAQPLELCPLCLAKVSRLFGLAPSEWAASVLGCVWPDAYPSGSPLQLAVAASIDRLRQYALLDPLL